MQGRVFMYPRHTPFRRPLDARLSIYRAAPVSIFVRFDDDDDESDDDVGDG